VLGKGLVEPKKRSGRLRDYSFDEVSVLIPTDHAHNDDEVPDTHRCPNLHVRNLLLRELVINSEARRTLAAI
jgi:hypothetical protein